MFWYQFVIRLVIAFVLGAQSASSASGVSDKQD